MADKDKMIHASDAWDAIEKWKHENDAHVFQVQHLGDALFVLLYSSDLVILDFKTGEVRGQYRLGEPFRLVSLGGDRLVVCAEQGSWILASE